MAVYYISPHTTTNGTGTWASPYSFNVATRTAFASGDELRVVSIPTSSLWTATVYTASVTTQYTLTVTAGGGLGADFVLGDVVYIVETGAYFRLYSKTTNVLSLYSSTASMMPLPSTSTTSVTLRRVNTTSYPAGCNSFSAYLYGNSSAPGVTVTDGWTADGVRVTDGSAHTVLYTSAASNLRLYDMSSQSYSGYGNSINLTYTFLIAGNAATAIAQLTLYTSASSTFTLGQVFSQYFSSGGVFTLGGTIEATANCTYTIRHVTNTPLLATATYGRGHTFNITNAQLSNPDMLLTSGSLIGGPVLSECTFNIGSTVGYTNSTAAVAFVFGTNGWGGDMVLNLYGTRDVWANSAVTGFLCAVNKDTTVNIAAGYTLYRNRRAATDTSLTYSNYVVAAYNRAAITGSPRIVNSSSITIPATDYLYAWVSNSSTPAYVGAGSTPMPITVYTANTTTSTLYGAALSNTLFISLNGAAPVELCAPDGGYTGSVGTFTKSTLPVASTDATVFRTTGPSLRIYLATKSTAMWNANAISWARKGIRIPCTSGVARTVSGYFRYNIPSGFVNGYAKFLIVFNGQTLASQNMTTAASGAWELFTLSFTPSQTGEFYLVWEFYFPVGASYMYLDDLTIT